MKILFVMYPSQRDLLTSDHFTSWDLISLFKSLRHHNTNELGPNQDVFTQFLFIPYSDKLPLTSGILSSQGLRKKIGKNFKVWWTVEEFFPLYVPSGCFFYFLFPTVVTDQIWIGQSTDILRRTIVVQTKMSYQCSILTDC